MTGPADVVNIRALCNFFDEGSINAFDEDGVVDPEALVLDPLGLIWSESKW
jgi:hypothetical protein